MTDTGYDAAMRYRQMVLPNMAYWIKNNGAITTHERDEKVGGETPAPDEVDREDGQK